MALDSGPERAVCMPGARESWLSREVANVRVTKGFDGVGDGGDDDDGR